MYWFIWFVAAAYTVIWPLESLIYHMNASAPLIPAAQWKIAPSSSFPEGFRPTPNVGDQPGSFSQRWDNAGVKFVPTAEFSIRETHKLGSFTWADYTDARRVTLGVEPDGTFRFTRIDGTKSDDLIAAGILTKAEIDLILKTTGGR